ncbi:hypothetical protein BM524_01350 [Alteromonas mediterranea]|uniref:Uncharacterized protein n=1 Tax=Alteromonas mediterranea TaxID=314275 RepID=A0AAC9NQH6_9ALTE|nr:hypothetical protein BM524_01350 [Alteromonas mediterranea]
MENFMEEKRTFLSHPMTLLVTGFIFTTILGTWISYYVDLSLDQRARTLDKVEQSRKAIQELSTYMYERRVRSELLLSSLKRQAPIEELKVRKLNYDESYVLWNKNI